jgi:hypothetical protein
MRRRGFITLLGGTAATWPLSVRAQQRERARRIGVLMNFAADDSAVVASEPFRQEVIAGVGRRLLLRDVRVPAVPTFTPVEDSFRRPAPRRARARRHRAGR